MSLKSRRKNNHIKMGPWEAFGVGTIYVVLTLLTLAFLVPFLYVLSASLTSEKALAQGGIKLFPSDISFDAYTFLFKYSEDILRAFGNTIIIAAATTLLMITVTAMFAYPLSKKDLPGRTGILRYVLFSMMFGGGLIPTYLLMHEYGFADSWLCMIIPGCYSSWNMILMRNYFSSIPGELEESALIDGAGYFTILSRIMIPLSKPIIATLSLFCVVGTWNNWYTSLLYLSNKKALWPIMMFLKTVLESTNPSTTMGMPVSGAFPPSESLKMAAVIVCITPILCAYPWCQKYFVKGMMIGSVKG